MSSTIAEIYNIGGKFEELSAILARYRKWPRKVGEYVEAERQKNNFYNALVLRPGVASETIAYRQVPLGSVVFNVMLILSKRDALTLDNYTALLHHPKPLELYDFLIRRGYHSVELGQFKMEELLDANADVLPPSQSYAKAVSTTTSSSSAVIGEDAAEQALLQPLLGNERDGAGPSEGPKAARKAKSFCSIM